MTNNPTSFRWIGGRLCLNFLNTADWNPDGGVAEEAIADTKSLNRWCAEIGIQFRDALTDSDLRSLHQFRQSLRDIFLSVIDGKRPDPTQIAELGREASIQSQQILTVSQSGQVTYDPGVSLEQAIAISAVSVLTDREEICRVKQCPGNSCGWLFLDETRNGRRRWCSMQTCGNRAKSRRHYQRRLPGEAAPAG